MANRTGRDPIETLITKPYKLVLVYTDGYMEIANYNQKDEKFSHFQPTSQNEQDALKEVLNINNNLHHLIPPNLYTYKDINNFSFVLKKGWKTLRFLNIDNPNGTITVPINEDGYSEIPTYTPQLLFTLSNNILSIYVKCKDKIYSNPLPNNFWDGTFCIGTADREWETEQNLSLKIDKITRMYIDSVFSHSVNHELLDSWFDGKPNLKLLDKIKWSI